MAKYGSTEQKEKAFRHERALRHTGGLNHVRVLTPAQLKDKNEGSSLLRAAMYGLAIGDSLGVPAEFMGRDSFCIDTMVG
ncbi:MAG: ADP-ribosylglycohydrolase family protein, partial [Raoultibacter sp.]